MTSRVRVLALPAALIALAALAALGPATVSAATAPAPRIGTVAPAAVCPLAANTDLAIVSVIGPTRADVLANDCIGAATADRPLTITAVTQGAYGAVTTDGTSLFYDPRACATGDSGGNDFSVTYTMTDGVGSRTGLAIFELQRPATAPVTDLPQVGFIGNSSIGSTVPLRLSWCGVAASGSSPVSYRVEQGTTAGVTFPTVVTGGTTATSTTRSATPNKNYAWRVRTNDTQGRIGAYATSLTSRVGLLQETGSGIAYSSGWKSETNRRYSGGRDRYTSRAGATATLAVTNVRAFAIVASRAPGRGSFHVYVDGVRVTSNAISQRSGPRAWRRVQYIRSLTSGAGVRHVIQVRATGNGRVDLDAILTLSGKRDQSITFATPAPIGATYAGATHPVGATASSGLPVSVRVHPSSWTACSLAAGVVSFHGAGSCRIDATQTGDATWNGRTASQTFSVARKALTATGITAADRTYDGTSAATIDVTAADLDETGIVGTDVVGLDTSAATGAFATAAAGADRLVTVNGLALTGADAANYLITAPTTNATISAAALTVSFTVADRAYDGTDDAVITGCSVATVLGGDVVTCDDSGATASFANANAGAGKTVTGSGFALAGADAANYEIDDVDTTTADITKATQSVAFTTTPPDPADITDTYDPAATATSGLTVTITVDPSAASVCHITAGEVAMDEAGTCILEASQAGNANYQAAAEVTQSFVVAGGAAQAITFDLSGVDATYGDGPIAISGSASSGLTVGFTSQTSAVCTVAGVNVTIRAAGTCSIRASQPGNATYAAAADVVEAFTVDRREITVTAVTDTRTADGTTDSAGTPTISSGSLAAGDTGTWSQAFATAAAGSGKTITPSGTVARGVTNVTASYDITFVVVATGVITPAAADVDSSTVAAAPIGVQNDGVDTVTVTVHLFDEFGNSLDASGGTVTIVADHGEIGVVTDNGDGTYTAVYTSDTFAGTVTISAELDGTPLTDTATITQG